MVSEISTSEQKPKQEKQFTQNSTINKLLNETTGLSKSQKDEYPTIGGKAFDTSRMSELMGYGKPEEVKRDMVAIDTFKRAGVTSEQVPEYITNALTRDYSSLMNVINKKDK